MDLVQRAKAIVLSPAAEWRAIEPESGDAGYLFVNYVALLAAIPPVCEFLRRGVFGWGGPHFHHFHHAGFFSSLFGAIVHYLATFVSLYLMAIIIDGLAPTFSAPKNPQNALKLDGLFDDADLARRRVSRSFPASASSGSSPSSTGSTSSGSACRS